MLKETRLAMRIMTTAYDYELASLIMAGAMDLETAGIHIPAESRTSANPDGRISKAISLKIGTNGKIVNESELSDQLIKRAIITYVRLNFGSPNDYDRLRESYDMQKVNLMHARAYTDYGTGEDDNA